MNRAPCYVPDLTPRQEDVLALLPSSLTAPEIGAKLGISTNTVKTHIYAIYRKLGVSSRREAIQLALGNPTILDMALTWIKSSLSKDQNCVEVANLPDGRVAMRNGKGGPELLFTALEWECFMDGVSKGEFDRFAES